MAEPLAGLRGISKRFGGVQALYAIDLEIQRGGVHALVGENGAGKSTLGKIIAGIHVPDDGSLTLDGQPMQFTDARGAAAAGITMIAQELPLVGGMSVIDNVFLGIETHRAGVVKSRASRMRFEKLMEQSDLRLDPVARVGTLRLADQQKVAILRALARDARLIVMDEPTASLSRTDAETVLAMIRGLAAGGTTIVFVSHFLKEVLAVADMVTVLKDGRLVRTRAAREESEETLVSAMLGRALEQRFPDRRKHDRQPTPILEVRSLTRRGAFEDVSLALDAGEIVGIAGLVGSGRSELARAIAGVDRFDGGEVLVNGRTLAVRHPAAAIKAGIALIPDNRRYDGLVMGQTIAENVTLPHLTAVSTCGIVRRRREAEVVERAARQSMMKVTRAQPVVNLSGGTQQKVMFAKWLVRHPTVLISDEPTRGIDVGAKRGIYDTLTAFSKTGVALLVISNEVDELLGLCHRIVVMRRGRLVAEFDAGEATEDAIMRVALGATPVSIESRAGGPS